MSLYYMPFGKRGRISALPIRTIQEIYNAPIFYRQKHLPRDRHSDPIDEEKNNRRLNRQFHKLNRQFRQYDPTTIPRYSDPLRDKAHSVGSQSRGLILQPIHGMPMANRLFSPGEHNPLSERDQWWDARGLKRKTRKRRKTIRHRNTKRHLKRAKSRKYRKHK